jgi:predicted RNA-binding Zn-ribbon protein involved in translation (DUF1610 family)
MNVLEKFVAGVLSRFSSANASPRDLPANDAECPSFAETSSDTGQPDFSTFLEVPPPLPYGTIECPACGNDMIDTGKTEPSDGRTTAGRLMHCPRCGNECLWSISLGDRGRRR